MIFASPNSVQCTPRPRASHWLAGLIVLLTSLLIFHLMVGRSRLGDPWNHTLTSRHFGVPHALAARGLTPFYEGKIEVGWDGQFYHFMANDLFARDSEAISHFDSPAYRYQRIGLPLLAKVLASMAGQEWVSPVAYFWTSLLLVVAATVALGHYFRTQGHSPHWALVWALAFGTQVTMQTGLPDAAADSLLILAFVCLACNRQAWYSIFAGFAALSREAYILLPAMVCLLTVLSWRRSGNCRQGMSWLLTQLLPCAVCMGLFLSWHLYLKIHLNGVPGSDVTGILGAPFSSYFRHLASGLQGHHLFVPPGRESYREAIQLLLFAFMLMATSWLALKALPKQPQHIQALSLTAISLAALYACFGDTVIMHFSGYLKAANVFLWIGPVLWFQIKRRINWTPIAFLSIYFLATIPPMWSIWIWNSGTAISRYTRSGDITDQSPQNCNAAAPALKIELLRREFPSKQNAFYQALRPYHMIAWVRVSNVGSVRIRSTLAEGSVTMASRWRDTTNGSLSDPGPRTMLATLLEPGESREIAVIVRAPRSLGEAELLIGPLQDRCKQRVDDVAAFSSIERVSFR